MSMKDMMADMKKGTNDQVIANMMLGGTKSMGSAYLLAAFESATPEVRRMYFQFVDQAVQAHGTLTELCIRKGWYKAYDTPDAQLKDWYDLSRAVVSMDSRV